MGCGHVHPKEEADLQSEDGGTPQTLEEVPGMLLPALSYQLPHNVVNSGKAQENSREGDERVGHSLHVLEVDRSTG